MRALKYVLPGLIVAAIAVYEGYVEYSQRHEAENMCLSPAGKTAAARESYVEHFHLHR
jgi:hypothetical protein